MMVLTLSTRAMPSFPGVALFMKNVRQYARKRGYVVTMTGRRRYLPAINSSNTKQRAAAERQVRVCVCVCGEGSFRQCHSSTGAHHHVEACRQ